MPERPVTDASNDRGRVGPLPGARHSDLGGEILEITGGLIERILTFEFGAECDLEEFGRRETAPLQLVVKVVGKLHLDTGHTYKCTPTRCDGQPSRRTRHVGEVQSASRRPTRSACVGVSVVTASTRTAVVLHGGGDTLPAITASMLDEAADRCASP